MYNMLSVEGIYQTKLEKFQDAAENASARVGSSGGVFANILNAIDERLSLLCGSGQEADGLFETSASYSGIRYGCSSGSDSENGEIEAAVDCAAGSTGLDGDLIRAVIQVESSFRTDAVSACGAQGLMQLMPGTAEEMGVEDPFDAAENVMGGAGYLKKLLNRFGDIRLALAAYNAGQGKIASLGITDPDDAQQYAKIPAGVRGYVDKVLSYWQQYENA